MKTKSSKIILVDARNTLFTKDGVFNEMYELLETYSNSKLVVTNANDEQLIEFGIDKSPYPIFTLKHNPDKVDPDFFRQLFKELDLHVMDAVYFEHNLEAVKSAKSVGINTFHYNRKEQDLESLKIFLDNNVEEK